MKKIFKNSLLNLFRSQFLNQSKHLSECSSEYSKGRRLFISNTSIAALGIGISPSILSSCSSNSRSDKSTVAILGGGIAGLHAGYILSKSNIDFKIFEASR